MIVFKLIDSRSYFSIHTHPVLVNHLRLLCLSFVDYFYSLVKKAKKSFMHTSVCVNVIDGNEKYDALDSGDRTHTVALKC